MIEHEMKNLTLSTRQRSQRLEQSLSSLCTLRRDVGCSARIHDCLRCLGVDIATAAKPAAAELSECRPANYPEDPGLHARRATELGATGQDAQIGRLQRLFRHLPIVPAARERPSP